MRYLSSLTRPLRPLPSINQPLMKVEPTSQRYNRMRRLKLTWRTCTSMCQNLQDILRVWPNEQKTWRTLRKQEKRLRRRNEREKWWLSQTPSAWPKKKKKMRGWPQTQPRKSLHTIQTPSVTKFRRPIWSMTIWWSSSTTIHVTMLLKTKE